MLLLRAGFCIYRPEADVDGEDLVVRKPDATLLAVQMKARPTIDPQRYGNRLLWMLFPDPKGAKPGRSWFLIPHDDLVPMFQAQRKLLHQPTDHWSCSAIPKAMRAKLEPFSNPHWRQPGALVAGG